MHDRDVWGSQLRKGVVELVVLAMLSKRESYAARIVEELRTHPDLAISSGTVYPMLARLLRAGLIASTWRESPVGPPRKYYRLTPKGERSLCRMRAAFESVSTGVRSVLEGGADAGTDSR